MKLPLRFSTLPLGVEIGAERVSIVVPEVCTGVLTVRESAVEFVPETPEARLDEAVGEALRLALASIRSRERRCILAAPWSEVFVRCFKLPPGMRRGEARRAAELEADLAAPWPSGERRVALDPIPGRRDEMLLSIARSTTLERLVTIAKGVRLVPIAIDAPGCAWRRAAPEADALLDASGTRAALAIFGGPAAAVHVFAPRLIDDRLAALVRVALLEARRDGIADVQRLAVFALPERFDALAALLATEGYRIETLRVRDVEAPPWALAYGLASWSLSLRSVA
jgi:hypothetical protein